MRLRVVRLALCALFAGGCAIVPEPPPAAPSVAAVSVVPHGIRFPVRAEDVDPRGRADEFSSEDVRGPVVLESGKAAALWIPSLEIVRISASTENDADALRISRVLATDGGDGTLRVEEPGIAAGPGVRDLVGPPGGGAIWLIESEEPTPVVIERFVSPAGRLMWEVVAARLREWIESGGMVPELPPHPEATAATFRLAAFGELRDGIVDMEVDASIRSAARSWLAAEVGRELDRMRPRVAPYYDRRSLDRQLRRVGPRRRVATELDQASRKAHRLFEGESTSVALRTSGAGELELSLRPVLEANATEHSPRSLILRSGDRVIATHEVLPRTATMTESGDALPSDRPLRTTHAEIVGAAERIRVPLGQDDQRLMLELSGGPILVRASHVRQRPWARRRDALPIGSHVSEGRTQLNGRDDASAVAVSSLLDHAAASLDDAPLTRLPSELTPALLFVADRAEDLDQALTRIALDRHGPTLGAWARAELARKRSATSSGLDPRLAELSGYLDELPLPAPSGAQTSARLGLHELAWRADPNSKKLRRRYLDSWYRDSRWSRLGAVAADGIDRHTAPRLRWLKVSPGDPVAPVKARGKRHRWRVPVATPFPIEIEPPLAQHERVRVVRFLVVSRASDPEYVTIDVDGREWSFIAIPGLESVAFTMDPGDHVVRVTHPEAIEIYSPRPPLAAAQPTAVAEMSTLFDSGAQPGGVRFRKPIGHAPGPVRVRVRAQLPVGMQGFDPAQEIEGRVVTDAGFERRFTLQRLRVDPTMMPMHGARPVSQAFDFVIWPPPTAWEIWIEPESDALPLVASIALRTNLPPGEPTPGPPTPASSERDVADVADVADVVELSPSEPRSLESVEQRIRHFSVRLRTNPDDHLARLRRARLLLDLRALEQARPDVAIVAERRSELDSTTVRLLDELQADIDATREPSSLPTGTQISVDAVNAASAFVIDGHPPAEDDEHDMATRAREAIHAGQFSKAAELYRELHRRSGQWRFAIGAADAYGLALEQDHEGTLAPFVYGFTRGLRDQGLMHPTLSRVHYQALRGSRWDRGSKPDRSAGYEWLIQQPTSAPAGTPISLRAAMVAAPWPQEQGRTLRRGQVSVVSARFVQPRVVQVDVVCQRLRGVRAQENDCPLALSVDGVDVGHPSLTSGQELTLAVGQIGEGDHTLELGLRTNDPGVAVATRFSSAELGSKTFEHMRGITRSRRHVASPSAAVAAMLIGPTTVEVAIRGLGTRPPTSATVTTVDAQGRASVTQVPLRTERDPLASIERSSSTPVYTKTIAYLPVESAEAHTITVVVDRGQALVRLRPRQARTTAASSVEASVPSPVASPDGVRWPGLAPGLAPINVRHEAPRRTSRAGTFSAEVIAAVDDVEDRDVVDERFRRYRGELKLAWQRAFASRRVLVDTGPRVGLRRDTGVVGGGDAALMALTALGLRSTLEGRVMAQPFGGDAAWSAMGRVRVGWNIRLDHRWTLIPDAFLTYRQLSLDEAAQQIDPGAVDPRVYTPYHEAHPIALKPRGTIRWTPTLTQVLSGRGSVTANSDFRSLDRIDIRLSWRGLFPTHRRGDVIVAASYAPTLRLADAHRTRTYLRNDLGAELLWSIWTGRTGRLSVGGRNTLFLYDDAQIRNTFRVIVRYDLSRGRGLYDLRPADVSFDEVIGRRYWQEDPPNAPR